MKISEIEAYFDAVYPPARSLEWDNDGLLVCPDRDRTVTSAVTCLDVTFPAIEKAIEMGAELIVSHHPLLFSPLKAVNEDTIPGQKVLLLLQHGISLLSFHTRCDGAERGLNREFAATLGIRLTPGVILDPAEPHIGGIGTLFSRMAPEDLARHVSETLNTPVRLYSAGTGIETVGVCCGSGRDLMRPALRLGADAFITGDVTYHAAQSVVEEGMTVIDCGHQASEAMAAELFAEELARMDPDLRVYPFREEPFDGEIIDARPY